MKENKLLIIAGIIFISGLVEFVITDYLAVAVAMVCFWTTVMSWVIIKCLKCK